MALLFVTVLFGFGHSDQGLTGMLDTGLHGLLPGALYLASGRNLWTCVIAHGVMDTVALFMAFCFGGICRKRRRRHLDILGGSIKMLSCVRLSLSTRTSPSGSSAPFAAAGRALKATVNEALRIGLGITGKPAKPPRFKIRAFVDGLQPGIDPDKMNQFLDEIESEEFARKHRE